MIHVLAFSGGKDSTAAGCWLHDRGIAFTPVFCDTGWEHPLTYAYVEEINRTLLGGRLVVLRAEDYAGGMRELVARKGRVPSPTMRFCTERLKVRPMIAWLAGLEDAVTLYQGIRAEESAARATLPERQWSDDYDCWIVRPLLRWSAADVFALLERHGVAANPLYRLGAARVGCFPCVLVGHRELKRLTATCPEVWERIGELERLSGRSFFYPRFIPARFHRGHDPKSGKSYPTAADVRRYLVETDEAQLALFGGEGEGAAPACLSIYHLCE